MHRSTEHHGVVNEGHGLQIWRLGLTIGILNKRSRTADEGWSCSFEFGIGLGNIHTKIFCVIKLYKGLGIEQIVWNDAFEL